MKFLLATLLALTVFTSGCGSDDDITKQLSAEKRFALGMEKFKDEDYLGAIDEFKIITLQYQGSKFADAGQFYLAQSRYNRGEYVLAAYEFDLLLKTMPTSPWVSKARYLKAMCYYNLSPEYYRDQEYSHKAIEEFQAFLEYSPTDSLASDVEHKISELDTKLARKEYENGVTYMNMDYYKAATMYFDLVLEKYHDTPYAEPAQFKKAEALYYRNRNEEALREIDKFLTKYANSTLRPDAEKLKQDIQSKLAAPKEPRQKAQNANTMQGIQKQSE